MIVISDTSVISNLLLINRLELLETLFNEIIIPQAVKDELRRLGEFGIDLSPFEDADWIIVQEPTNLEMKNKLMESLDMGESAAITLAYELDADYLAIDERAGRKTAKTLGLNIIGLVGILVYAKDTGHILNVKPILDKLILEAGFYIRESFYNQILQDLGEV